MLKLARSGLSVITTIHQPSAEVFSCFDNVLLLQDGRQAFFGDKQSSFEFFDGVEIQPEENPAEFLLSSLQSGLVAEKWQNSAERNKVLEEIDTINHSKSLQETTTLVTYEPPTVLTQIIALTSRTTKNFYRDASFSFSKLFISFAVALLIGLSFFRLGNSIAGMQNRMFSVFLILFIPPVWMNVLIFKLFSLRTLWMAREKHLYSKFSFCTSILLSQVPYSLICSVMYWSIWYFLAGYPIETSKLFYCKPA
jgi:ATP-binding cassette, subfamily G (WHITE), member 2, SNQ2